MRDQGIHTDIVITRRAGRQRRAFALVAAAVVFSLLGAGAPLLIAVGATWYVDDDTCPAAGTGSPATPFCKIQDAICVAAASDTVSVALGTYTEAVRMKPGVSLISQSGPAGTTINAAGQPCTDSNWCTKRPGSQCSVVTFASGHTTSTRLEGFTLTGGAGLPQVAPPSLNHVAGGGIFVFSSPTIVNNVITNNVLTGSTLSYRGAGIYVSVGSPVISGNTITGNVAIAGPGTLSDFTYGYGGGIWVNWNTSPIITNNVIQGNRAGDPNVAYSLGGGGGIAVWPGDANHPGPVIDRNLIADNYTDSLGAGVSINSLPNTSALAAVTNNVIVGNRADKNGGGVYIYFVKASVINNTITDNWAFLGGGVYTGQNEVNNLLPVKISNNIIEGNRIYQFGNGGGIYSLDLEPTFDPEIRSNDLIGNDLNNAGGEISDATVIGTNGNISSLPRFVNEAGRNFHLDPNSPAIDRASSTGAPPVDRDNQPRGYDGNGMPNNPMAGDVDMGAYEFSGSCLPAPEVCDGLDNDCDFVVDNGFLNTDGDLQANCIDPDDDNDGVADTSDCASLDAGSFGMPTEVLNVNVTGPLPTTTVTFDTQNIGSATRYEVVVGLLSRMVVVGFQEDFCANSTVTGGSWNDTRSAPPAGDGWFYIVRSANACGLGTLGSAAADAAGSGNVCAAGVVDFDGDGSPSDLDCNDNNPSLSPVNPEVCDGFDNNCDQVADEGNPGGGQSCGTSTGECSQGVTLCSSGSLTCVGGVGPSPEVCDGLDNDCNQIVDNGFPDTDGDLQANCVDPDDDNDGTTDPGDCAPLDAGSWGLPVEVQDVDVQDATGVLVSWQEQPLGPATRYEVASGAITLPGQISFATGICVGPAAATSPMADGRAGPPADVVWYYLVKSRNVCGPGTYGSPERNTLPPCP